MMRWGMINFLSVMQEMRFGSAKRTTLHPSVGVMPPKAEISPTMSPLPSIPRCRVPELLQFYWRVSSESGFDYLRFFDNNDEKKKISGNVDWQEVNYNVSSGNHTLKWSYTKDLSIYDGMDCGWVDYITFTPSTRVNVMPCLYPLLLV